MFRFTIRDMFWLMAVVACTLLFGIERHKRKSESAALKAQFEQTDNEREDMRWQLMHAKDELEAAGFTVESDGKHIHVAGPYPQGWDSVTITRIKNGEMLQILADGEDVTKNFISATPPPQTSQDAGEERSSILTGVGSDGQ